MDVLITRGPRSKSPEAVQEIADLRRQGTDVVPVHILDTSTEDVGHNVNNFIGYYQALGLTEDPVVLIPAGDPLLDVQADDWRRDVDSALGTHSEVRYR